MRPLRLLAVCGVLSLVGTLAGAAGSSAEPEPAPQRCVATLDCGIDEIDHMSMPDRLDFVRGLEAGPATEALAGHNPRQWRNIEGIVTAFRNHGAGARGGWVSLTDAGILEGVERGLAIATGRSTDTGGNPGAPKWAKFVTGLASGKLDERSAHDRAWSAAEQASTEYGDRLARQRGEYPNAEQQRFYELTDVYRFAVRNRPAVLDHLRLPGRSSGPASVLERQSFYDWATDTTNIEAGRTGGEVLWQMSQADVPNSASGGLSAFDAYLRYLYPEYAKLAGPR